MRGSCCHSSGRGVTVAAERLTEEMLKTLRQPPGLAPSGGAGSGWLWHWPLWCVSCDQYLWHLGVTLSQSFPLWMKRPSQAGEVTCSRSHDGEHSTTGTQVPQPCWGASQGAKARLYRFLMWNTTRGNVQWHVRQREISTWTSFRTL